MRRPLWSALALVAAIVVTSLEPALCAQAAGAQSRLWLPIVRKTWPPYPATPWLGPIHNDDGDGVYDLYWSPIFNATTYVLEEKWQDADWFVAYRGFTRQIQLRNRPAGTYWYRCRAENSFGFSGWSNLRQVVVQGQAPGTIRTPSSTSVSADGLAVIKVVNDCPYALRVDLTGPEPRLMELPQCDICHVYSFIGPFFCQTSGRPIDEIRLQPGPYRVYVSVSAANIKPWVGYWQLQGNRRYTVCFYIVRTFGTDGRQTWQLVPADGQLEGSCR